MPFAILHICGNVEVTITVSSYLSSICRTANAITSLPRTHRQNAQPKVGYFYTIAETPTTIQPLSYVDLV